MSKEDPRILLIISGGIAAYKSLDLISRLRKSGVDVQCILSGNAHHFVTPLSVKALSEAEVNSDLFAPRGALNHIHLSEEADLVVVAPATANLLAKMAGGLADDLASATLLASNTPILVAPSMNTRMWEHPATRENFRVLQSRGVHAVGPGSGNLACGSSGTGRMAEPEEIMHAIAGLLGTEGPLSGFRALVTSGPTHEALDPLRYLANRSSGRQGHAIAGALARAGAACTLISGPVQIPDPPGLSSIHVETAMEMAEAVEACLPVDIAVCAAAVADWRPMNVSLEKMKKTGDESPTIQLLENPDILKTLGRHPQHRPNLLVGFAAETTGVLASARRKLEDKACDLIIANDVSPENGVFGGVENTVHLIDSKGTESWPTLSKEEIALRLVERITGEVLARR